jgi:hypothetical protein
MIILIPLLPLLHLPVHPVPSTSLLLVLLLFQPNSMISPILNGFLKPSLLPATPVQTASSVPPLTPLHHSPVVIVTAYIQLKEHIRLSANLPPGWVGYPPGWGTYIWVLRADLYLLGVLERIIQPI